MKELAGTKEAIFDIFLEMVSNAGYENVGMREIAREVGIQVASIYNHFETKLQILESAYDYYRRHMYDNRKPVEMMKKLIETADAAEMVNTFSFTFESADHKKYKRMILITKVVYMRLFQDEIAKDIFSSSNNNNEKYITEILQHGVATGRIVTGFDIETFADVFIGALHIMGIKAFAEVDYEVGQLEQEKRIIALLTQLLATGMNRNFRSPVKSIATG